MSIYQPYTYHLYHRPTGKHYYGVQFGKKAHPSNLWTTYFTSSHRVKTLIEEFGKDSFDVEVRRTFETAEEALLWEETTLRRLSAVRRDDWLNQGNHGQAFSNHGHTEGTKTKISETRKRKGHRHSSETKAKMSTTRKGRKHSTEARKNMSVAQTGRVQKQETKAKLSAAFAKTYLITKPDGSTEIIVNMKAYCAENNLDPRNMCSVVKGRIKHHKGYSAQILRNTSTMC